MSAAFRLSETNTASVDPFVSCGNMVAQKRPICGQLATAASHSVANGPMVG